MAHSYALSVSRANLCSEIWQNRLAETGIKNVECCTGPFSDFSEAKDTVEKINPAIQAGCFQIVSLHLPFWWGAGELPSQPDEFSRKICAERLKRQIELFSSLGMKHLTLHPGTVVCGQSRANGVSQVRRTVETLIPTVEKYGMSLNLEICPRGAIGGVPEEMESLIDNMPECIGICFDVNHADDRYAEIPDWIAQLGKRIRTFHLSDCDGQDECHWFPGIGILDWEKIMKEINRLDHDCVLIMEVEQDGCKVPAFLKRETDPVWFLRRILKHIEYLKNLCQ